MIRLLAGFETDPEKYKHMHQYDVMWHRYEFLDGTVKCNLQKRHFAFLVSLYNFVIFVTIGII